VCGDDLVGHRAMILPWKLKGDSVICRLFGVFALALIVAFSGCGRPSESTPPREARHTAKIEQPPAAEAKPSRQEKETGALSQIGPSEALRTKRPAPVPHTVKRIDTRLEFHFSEPTPEATLGMPLVIEFSGVPEVPEEILGPSPPIQETTPP